MTERPILMSGAMVRACLREVDPKTQTRRVVRNPYNFSCLTGDCPHWDKKLCADALAAHSPYGQAGDRLWVRETFAFDVIKNNGFRYRADVDPQTDGWTWTPSIHMPRAACRLVLEVTGVRVERLQAITWRDAFAEGFEPQPVSADPTVHRDAARDWYMDLWDSLNAKRGFGWATNPWVWVVSFKRADALRAAA
jgi:hypothetical protein